MSVQDSVRMSMHSGDEGSAFSPVKMSFTNLDKPQMPKIMPIGKPRSFIDMMTKPTAYVPGPDKYKTDRSYLNMHTNTLTTKSKRETEAAFLMRIVKKRNFPAPGSYKLNYTRVEKGIHGTSTDRLDRVGYLDEAAWKGQFSPEYRKPSLEPIKKRIRNPMIMKEHPQKPVVKTNLSPASYNSLASYKASQLGKGQFSIPKGSYDYNKGDRKTQLTNFRRNTSFC